MNNKNLNLLLTSKSLNLLKFNLHRRKISNFIEEFSINQLIKKNFEFGSKKIYWKRSFSFFFLGIKRNLIIFDLNVNIFILKNSLNFLKLLYSLFFDYKLVFFFHNQKIDLSLFSNNDFFKTLLIFKSKAEFLKAKNNKKSKFFFYKKILKNKNFYFNSSWVNGYFTNFFNVYKYFHIMPLDKKQQLNWIINKAKLNAHSNFLKLKRLPDFVLILKSNFQISKETSKMKIPSIGFSSYKTKLSLVDYPIFLKNSISFSNFRFFFDLFINFILCIKFKYKFYTFLSFLKRKSILLKLINALIFEKDNDYFQKFDKDNKTIIKLTTHKNIESNLKFLKNLANKKKLMFKAKLFFYNFI